MASAEEAVAVADVAAASFAVENAADAADVDVAMAPTVVNPVVNIVVAGAVEDVVVATTSTSPMRLHSQAWALRLSRLCVHAAGLEICLYRRTSYLVPRGI